MFFANARTTVLLVALAVLGVAAVAAAESPLPLELDAAAIARAPMINAQPIDKDALLIEDADREAGGLPPRFAEPQVVSITPEAEGSWNVEGDWATWRLRITADGATSLNLGFTRYRLPKNSRLAIFPADAVSADDARGVRVFTEQDNKPHGELWTPVVISNDIVVELTVPASLRHDYDLELGSINRGYRFFDELFARAEAEKAGSCNVDVVCPEGDDWRLEINSVGVISTGGSTFCTGSMINNTANDGTPYFLTANHCGITTSNDQSLVVYWNFQSPTCGQQGGGSLSDFQTGSTHLASGSASDFTLVLMDDMPDPAHEVSYAGWDRSGAEASTAIAIHHPSTDEKSISFEYDATTTTSYLQNTVPGDGTHVRITDWDLGTTEPGSSGSPLFNQDHRVIGQLHGGYASCTSQTSDWYGKFSVSFSSLSQWLDPGSTGAQTTDTLAPWATGLAVGGSDLAAEGQAGGPFTPSSASYTLTNNSAFAIDYSAAIDVNWAEISSGASGSIAAGGTATVNVALTAAADALPNGGYNGTITITNLTDGDGSTTRAVSLTVGVPVLQVSFPFDSDPGWTTAGQWAFGTPTGGGGQYGNPDPTSAHTGTNVYGYNLSGDYANNLAQTHLVSTAIDCSDYSGVEVKFWRYLNVEQPTYDHAYFWVSNDGTNWTEVWTNTAQITDAAWTQVVYDISAVADGQATVYLRWTMGATDSSWQFSGWNIDDVEIFAVAADDPLSGAGDVPAQRLAVGNHPNPFNPLTTISWTVGESGAASLAIYDVQGRLVKRLVSDFVAAGDYTTVWDGSDDSGRRVGSGLYFARLTAGGSVVQHKMVMLK